MNIQVGGQGNTCYCINYACREKIMTQSEIIISILINLQLARILNLCL